MQGRLDRSDREKGDSYRSLSRGRNDSSRHLCQIQQKYSTNQPGFKTSLLGLFGSSSPSGSHEQSQRAWLCARHCILACALFTTTQIPIFQVTSLRPTSYRQELKKKKTQKRRKISWKFVYILAKQYRSPFDLTNFFETKNPKIFEVFTKSFLSKTCWETPHCSKSSFFVQKFNFDFPRKLSIFLGEKLVKMLWFWTFQLLTILISREKLSILFPYRPRQVSGFTKVSG